MRIWLKNIRQRKGMSQQVVADSLGITRQYYQQIETDKRQKKMNALLIFKLSQCFKLSVDDILLLELQNNSESKTILLSEQLTKDANSNIEKEK